MIYLTEVWLNNKITVVVGDDCELFEKELIRFENQGGVVLAKYAQENDLEEVIVCTKKGATAVTAAKSHERNINVLKSNITRAEKIIENLPEVDPILLNSLERARCLLQSSLKQS